MKYLFLLLVLICSPAFGQTIERLDNVKQAPITVRRPNGQTLSFGLGASTDALRGTALIAAQAAATAGDTIHLDAGTYDLNTATTLNKVGINYDLAAGATITRTASTVRRIFYDSAGELTGTISGGGSVNSNAGNSSPLGVCFDLRDADTDLTFIGKDVISTGGEAIYVTNAVDFTAKLSGELSAGYDAIIWEGLGSNGYVEGQIIAGTDNCVEYGGGNFETHFKVYRSSNENFQCSQAATGDRLIAFGDRAYCTEYTGATTDAFLSADGTSNGSLEFHINRIESHIRIASTGVNAIAFYDCDLNTTDQAFPSIVFSAVSGTPSGLVLSNVRITTKSDQSESIDASVPVTIEVIGNVSTNKAIDSDITFTGPGTVTAAGVCVYMGTKTVTTAGLDLLDDASVTAQRNTLGATSGVWGASQVAGTTFSVNAAGTAAGLGAAYATLDFGTTDPTITITRAGTYLILARVEFDDLALAAQYTPKFKLRRTNNTAADVSNSEALLTVPSSTEIVKYSVALPPAIYTTANANDVIALFGQDVDEAGVTVSKASIQAIQISTGTP
jgi:hypothetical protein